MKKYYTSYFIIIILAITAGNNKPSVAGDANTKKYFWR